MYPEPKTLTPRIQNKPDLMDFPTAIRRLTNGKKIRRVEWPKGDYGLLKDSFLTIYRNGVFHRWLVNDGDLEATDWIVLIEEVLS